MENIRKRLINISNFDQLNELIMLEENVEEATSLLNKINSNVSYQNLLSSFIIFNCSKEIIGEDNISENKDLIKTSKSLIFSDDIDSLKQNLNIYIKYFNEWKLKDFKIIIDSLCNEYFQTNIKLLTCESKNIEKKVLLCAYKNKIIKSAQKLNPEKGAYIVKSYNPIDITYSSFYKKYDSKYWEIFNEQYDLENYTLFYSSISTLKDIYIKLSPNNKEVSTIFSINYFTNILEIDNDYDNDDIIFFANKGYDLIKLFLCITYHPKLEEYRFDVNSNSRYLPDIIKNFFFLTSIIITDIEEFT